ncbi:hypothetical protein MGYG_05004 [Nannizzia gypsea CBS 118893]|uniref:Uncharacterized protein n=1 Tax=Arthroderma gypseum (strain ATCC MYA-4604 / CBS 118893) TaxID=535722 RepID=E4UY08_ARTGP|nr:hypothetical protein MGYG_05004 [Nannizzia gypsea CBS 118893]EFR02001.1 hypothetical protein MGYG_05004 [Nannizzia gypsea CBS 118893]
MADRRPNAKARPRIKVTWWLRMKCRLLRQTSPLRIRGSLTGYQIQQIRILFAMQYSLVLLRHCIGVRRNGKHIHRQHGSDPYPPYDPLFMPSWVRDVPAVTTSYLRSVMPESKLDSDGRLVLIDGENEIFRKRNIIASEYRFYTI